jgi:DNA-binding transcriptional LysR family regulator
MLYAREDTTGALVREARAGRLDVAVAFCPPAGHGLAEQRLADEPAVVHLPADHPLAAREALELGDLAEETFLVAGGPDSPGYTQAVVAACRAAGFEPRTLPDPHPDLGLQAVREGLGVVLYVAAAFGPGLEGTVLRPVTGVTLPFALLWRAEARSGALDAVLDLARGLDAEPGA